MQTKRPPFSVVSGNLTSAGRQLDTMLALEIVTIEPHESVWGSLTWQWMECAPVGLLKTRTASPDGMLRTEDAHPWDS